MPFPPVGYANGEFVLNGVVDLDGFHHFAKQAHAAAPGSVAGGSIVIHGAVSFGSRWSEKQLNYCTVYWVAKIKIPRPMIRRTFLAV